MGKSIIVLPADHAAWLKERQYGIGASDAAAMLGISKWKSNEALWEEKTGLRAPEDISGKRNHFRKEYRDTATWSWEMEDPYVGD